MKNSLRLLIFHKFHSSICVHNQKVFLVNEYSILWIYHLSKMWNRCVHKCISPLKYIFSLKFKYFICFLINRVIKIKPPESLPSHCRVRVDPRPIPSPCPSFKTLAELMLRVIPICLQNSFKKLFVNLACLSLMMIFGNLFNL